MGIKNYSEEVILATLPREPQLGDELETLTELASEGCDHDVIIDFSNVVVLTSESLCSLMILDKYLSATGRKLVFCSASAEVRHVFKRTGLAAVFSFVDDEYAALKIVRSNSCLYG